jgi:tousled-like kinase
MRKPGHNRPYSVPHPLPVAHDTVEQDDEDEDDVASFSTEGSSLAEASCAPTRSHTLSRERTYGPPVPPPVESPNTRTPSVSPESAINAEHPQAKERCSAVTPAAPTKRASRKKRGRPILSASPNGSCPPTKSSRVDAYFKPAQSAKMRAAKAIATIAAGAVAAAAEAAPQKALPSAGQSISASSLLAGELQSAAAAMLQTGRAVSRVPDSMQMSTTAAAAAGGNPCTVRRELAFPSPSLSTSLSPEEAHAQLRLCAAAPFTPGASATAAGSLTDRPADAYSHLRRMIDSLRDEVDTLKTEAQSAVTEREDLEAENEDLRAQIDDVPSLVAKVASTEAQVEAVISQRDRMRNSLHLSLVECARAQRADARRKSAASTERLGRVVTERSGTKFTEVWEDGLALRELRERLHRIQAERELLERKRRDLVKLKKSMPPPPIPGAPYEQTTEFTSEVEEVLKLQAASLKREEADLMEVRARMTMERDCLFRELGRQSDEVASHFGNFPVLNDRYLALNLLGRGGFSEVFRAYDFVTARFVACKIHQLASNWSEARKQTFLRHMLREQEIHKSLSHPRILRALDSFELDTLTVVSVLELCEGQDLDILLRKNGALPEREARSIIAQVFAGLVYLDENVIVHYDLKPGNILLDAGQVRITDFGLSKINSECAADGMMELTSQGAGTMWYLPPECFVPKVAGGAGPRICSKVDVWSAGVILYQILYGSKPFGAGIDQSRFFLERTCATQELQFPARPGVSDAAKEFIRLCLTRNVVDRPDVRTAANHPFIRPRK